MDSLHGGGYLFSLRQKATAAVLVALTCSRADAQITNLGGGLAGSEGIPRLLADIQTGSATEVWPHAQVAFDLRDAAPNASSAFILGWEVINFPILGGILVPRPDVNISVTTDSTGRATFQLGWPNTQDPLYIQCVVIDPNAPQGLAFSNTLSVQGTDISATSESFLTDLLGGANEEAAADAYAELVTRGHAGITELVNFLQTVAPSEQYAAMSPAPYWASNTGSVFVDATSGQLYMRKDSCRRIAMYAIDAILADNAFPYRNTYLTSQAVPALANEFVEDEVAATAYIAWWTNSATQTLAQLQAGPRPLDGATIAWAGSGPQLPNWFALFNPTYQCLPGTETPAKRPFRLTDIVNTTTPAGTPVIQVPPENPDGPTPTNCLGSALGVEGWVFAPVWEANPDYDPSQSPSETNPVNRESEQDLGDVMENEGFTEEEDTTDQQQGEVVVANVYVRDDENDPNPTDDKKWQHSMTRKWDAATMQFVWCSKDADGAMYRVTDAAAFNGHLIHIGVLKFGQHIAVEFFSR